MSKYWNTLTASLVPYVPGEQPKDKKYIKLNTNENPYPPSPKVLAAIKEAANEDLRLYPDPTCTELVYEISQYYNVSTNQVFVGNGSDEVLAFAFNAFFEPGKTILFPDVTYTFYEVYARLYNLQYKLIPVDEDFNIPLEKFYLENGGIIIPNPNAPTTKYISIDSFEFLLERNKDSVVIIDEAYVDFGGESLVKWVDKYPNLLVIQTLSKSRSLAGLRVGIAIGNEQLIQGLERIKNSFNSYTLDRFAIKGATAAFQDKEYFKETTQKVIRTRERVTKELRELGFKILDSKANFVFISHSERSAKEIFQELREKGILIRYFEKKKIDNYLRVSIGTEEEMDDFIRALREVLSI